MSGFNRKIGNSPKPQYKFLYLCDHGSFQTNLWFSYTTRMEQLN